MNFTEIFDGIEILEKIMRRNAALRSTRDGRYRRNKEKLLIRKLRNHWKAQMSWILAGMQFLSFFEEQEKTKGNKWVGKTAEEEVEYFVRQMPRKEAVADDIVQTMGVVMLRSGKKIIKDLRLGQYNITFSLEHREAKKFLGRKLSHELSNFRGNINQTTHKRIAKLLKNSAKKGESIQEASQHIIEQGKEGVFSPARGELIAQTELGRAYGKGQNMVMRDFKVRNPGKATEKKWFTVGDERVRPEHSDNASDGWIPLEQVHSGTGEEYAPSADFACRCAEEYRVR